MPGDASIYRNPLPCGVSVLNGFAKPAGLTQIEELGVLETPILLSNTLAVGRLFTGLARFMITHHPEIGRTLPTVNPLVLECNDGFLNDIQAMAITESMAQQALDLAATDFLRGSVGAGRARELLRTQRRNRYKFTQDRSPQLYLEAFWC
ncbi:P1 family peptidase [Vibrio sp. PP-XX7]